MVSTCLHFEVHHSYIGILHALLDTDGLDMVWTHFSDHHSTIVFRGAGVFVGFLIAEGVVNCRTFRIAHDMQGST